MSLFQTYETRHLSSAANMSHVHHLWSLIFYKTDIIIFQKKSIFPHVEENLKTQGYNVYNSS